MSKRVTRRTFMRKTAVGAALIAAPWADAAASVLGANDRVRVGVAGINGRGRAHYGAFGKMKDRGVEVAYLIDPDSRLFDSRSKDVERIAGNKPTCVQDVREALEDKDLDAISIATCNHWHSLMTIWACQAGKDVYVEKPMSHNIFEGRMAVEAARKYDRIVQHGTQQRSSTRRHREIAAVQSGEYGELLVSKGYCCKPRWSIGTKPIGDPPAELNFDIWLGPAREQPYHENLVHHDWHWFWDTGNGDIGNQGVHEMDVARWAIKDATLPTRVWSLGGRFGYRDQGETPNTQMAVMEFGDVILLFETRGLVGVRSKSPRRVANEYYTTEGMITAGKFYPKNGGKAESLTNVGGEARPGGEFGSFINAVRSRKREDLNAEILEGHYSSALCHLANISYRLGDCVPFDRRKASLGDNKQVQECFKAIEDNLTKGVGLKLDDVMCRRGRTLTFDPDTERFDDDEANRLLTRDSRGPYTVPTI